METVKINPHLAFVRCIELTDEYNTLVSKHNLRLTPLSGKNIRIKAGAITPVKVTRDHGKSQYHIYHRLYQIIGEYMKLKQEMAA